LKESRERTTQNTYPTSETNVVSDESRYGRDTNTGPGPLGAGLDFGTGPTPVDQSASVEQQPSKPAE